MALHPRRGDRQRRHEQRGLMLDLLLADATACTTQLHDQRARQSAAAAVGAGGRAARYPVCYRREPRLAVLCGRAASAGGRTSVAGLFALLCHRRRPAPAQPQPRTRRGRQPRRAGHGGPQPADDPRCRRRRARRVARRRCAAAVLAHTAGRTRSRLAPSVADAAGGASAATCRYLLRRRLGIELPYAANDRTTSPSCRTVAHAPRWRAACTASAAPGHRRRGGVAPGARRSADGRWPFRQLQGELEALQAFAQRLREATAEAACRRMRCSSISSCTTKPGRCTSPNCNPRACWAGATATAVPATTSKPGCNT